MFQIEKNIPVPPVKQTRPTKYPVQHLGVDESFFVPVVKCEEGAVISAYMHRKIQRVRCSIGSTINNVAYRESRKFKTRILDENGSRGVRVWRVS